MTTTRAMLIIAAIALAGCTGPTRGGVRPAPPGPRDIVHGVLFGDFSRLCPEHYDFCSKDGRSICCPSGGCCEDASGPYCCEGYTHDRRSYDYDEDRRESFTDWDARAEPRPMRPQQHDMLTRRPCPLLLGRRGLLLGRSRSSLLLRVQPSPRLLTSAPTF